MRAARTLLSTFVLLCLSSFLQGCGIVFAPVIIPHVLLANETHEAKGHVTDEAGRPLDNVTVDYETSTLIWNPFDLFSGTDYISQSNSETFNSEFHLRKESANDLELKFTSPGYYPRKFRLNGSVVRNEAYDQLPDPPTALRVRLLKKGLPAKLNIVSETLRLLGDGSRVVFAPAKPRNSPAYCKAIGASETVPPGYLYINANHDDLGIPTRKYDNGTLLVGLKIGISGPGHGIQLFTPANNEDSWYDMRQAPDSGYSNEILLDDATLQQISNDKNKIWFYIHTDNQYGRGCFEVVCTCHTNSEDVPDHKPRVDVNITLYMQPNSTTNLEMPNK